MPLWVISPFLVINTSHLLKEIYHLYNQELEEAQGKLMDKHLVTSPIEGENSYLVSLKKACWIQNSLEQLIHPFFVITRFIGFVDNAF